MTSLSNGSDSKLSAGTWRRQAAGVVEALCAVTGAEMWDELLDLRELLLFGSDWGEVLDHFLVCRHRLERDHYVPFYRLRRLLEGHLRLSTRSVGQARVEARLADLGLWRHRGIDDLRRRAQLDHWEQGDEAAGPGGVRVEVVEAMA